MARPTVRKLIFVISTFLLLWLALRYLLPVSLPFLLGGGLALGAEPLVRFLCGKLGFRRGLAAGIGVSIAFAMLVLVLMLLGALAVKEVRNLSSILPQAQQMIQSGLSAAQDFLLGLSQRMPDGISSFMAQTVTDLFSGSAALLSKVTDRLLGLATGLLGRIPNGALGFGTGIVSSYMISAKLPRIREALRQRVPKSWKEQYLPALQTVKASVGAYLLAQAKLASVTFAIVTGGLLILGTHLAPLWGFLIALVDAVPLLGTGTVMLPWALVCFLQDDHVRAIGILAVYAAAVTTRSVLEPRLIGRQMGLDPLVTLVALYLGFRLWGGMGMLLAPLAAATAIRLSNTGNAQAPFDEGAGTEERGS